MTKISADLLEGDGWQWRGCVDGFEPGTGLLGWAINIEQLDIPQRVEVVVDGLVIYDCVAETERADIQSFFESKIAPSGFRVPPEVFSEAQELVGERLISNVVVRIQGTSLALPCVEGFEWESIASGIVLAARREASSYDLLSYLRRVRQHASFRAPDVQDGWTDQIGVIETWFLDDLFEDVVWFVGWIREDRIVGDVVVADDNGIITSASFSLVKFRRHDLTDPAIGVIGLLCSPWRPVIGSASLLRFGRDGELVLKAVPEPRLVGREEFEREFRASAVAGVSGRWDEMANLLSGRTSRSVALESQTEVRAAIDRTRILPGFGCVATGWILSFLQQPTSFNIIVDGRRYASDGPSIRRFGRPDLAGPFPDAAHIRHSAGFVVVFIFAEVLTWREFRLEMLMDSGSTISISGDPRTACQLGVSEPIDSLLDLYPSLEHEGFFPVLCTALRKSLAERYAPVRVVRQVKGLRAVLVCVPSNRENARLVAECADRLSRRLPSDTCLVLVIGKHELHSAIAHWCNYLCRKTPGSVGIVSVNDVDFARSGILQILSTCEAGSFLFVPPTVLFDPELLADLDHTLTLASTDLVIGEERDPVTGLTRQGDISAFAWNKSDLFALERRRQQSLESFVRATDGSRGPFPKLAAFIYTLGSQPRPLVVDMTTKYLDARV